MGLPVRRRMAARRRGARGEGPFACRVRRPVRADPCAAGRAAELLPRALGDTGNRRARRRHAAPCLGQPSLARGSDRHLDLRLWAGRDRPPALAIVVDGEPLCTSIQSTWNVLEPSAGPALAEAAAAGARLIVKEAVANGRLAPGGADGTPGPRRVATIAAELGVGVDQLATAAALAQPWAVATSVCRVHSFRGIGGGEARQFVDRFVDARSWALKIVSPSLVGARQQDGACRRRPALEVLARPRWPPRHHTSPIGAPTYRCSTPVHPTGSTAARCGYCGYAGSEDMTRRLS
jgi:hypothetical protein